MVDNLIKEIKRKIDLLTRAEEMYVSRLTPEECKKHHNEKSMWFPKSGTPELEWLLNELKKENENE